MAIPDSTVNSSATSHEIYNFKLANGTQFCYVYFYKNKDNRFERGCFMSSIFIIVSHPFNLLYTQIVKIVGESYFTRVMQAFGDNKTLIGDNKIYLSSMFAEIAKWPKMIPNHRYNSLTMFGKKYHISYCTPKFSFAYPLYDEQSKALRNDKNVNVSAMKKLRRVLEKEMNFLEIFKHPNLHGSLHHFWECVMLGDKILVVAANQSPKICSDMVYALCTLILPVYSKIYHNNVFPYFTINHSKYHMFLKKNHQRRACYGEIIGVTNPFFLKSYSSNVWPYLISCGEMKMFPSSPKSLRKKKSVSFSFNAGKRRSDQDERDRLMNTNMRSMNVNDLDVSNCIMFLKSESGSKKRKNVIPTNSYLCKRVKTIFSEYWSLQYKRGKHHQNSQQMENEFVKTQKRLNIEIQNIFFDLTKKILYPINMYYAWVFSEKTKYFTNYFKVSEFDEIDKLTGRKPTFFLVNITPQQQKPKKKFKRDDCGDLESILNLDCFRAESVLQFLDENVISIFPRVFEKRDGRGKVDECLNLFRSNPKKMLNFYREFVSDHNSTFAMWKRERIVFLYITEIRWIRSNIQTVIKDMNEIMLMDFFMRVNSKVRTIRRVDIKSGGLFDEFQVLAGILEDILKALIKLSPPCLRLPMENHMSVEEKKK